MSNVVRHRNPLLPKQSEEIARLRVRKGADVGSVFIITECPVSIGRGEENDITIADLKSSRKHGVIHREAKGRFYVADAGSANGILFKDKLERQFIIQHGSIFSIGETEFEFCFAELLPELQPKTKKGVVSLPSVNPLTGIAVATYQPSAFQTQSANPNAGQTLNAYSGSSNSQPNKKKNLILAALGLFAAMLFFGNDQIKKNKVVKKDEPKRDLASLLPPPEEGNHVDAADTLFKSGFREYREKNYLRAKTLFETVLQVSPGHILAEKYLSESETSIKQQIQFHLKKGREELNTGRLKTAKGHYETVLRLLFKDLNDPAALEAKDQLIQIKVKMSGGSTS